MRNQKIRIDCQSWYEAKQSNSEEAQRSQIESVSVERSSEPEELSFPNQPEIRKPREG